MSKLDIPGPWWVWFLLVRSLFVRNFKTAPKYLVHADSTFYDRESSPFVPEAPS